MSDAEQSDDGYDVSSSDDDAATDEAESEPPSDDDDDEEVPSDVDAVKSRHKRAHSDGSSSSSGEEDFEAASAASREGVDPSREARRLARVERVERGTGRLRAAPKKRVRREDAILEHERAVARLRPFDIRPSVPVLARGVRLYTDSLRRLERIPYPELMQKFCTLRVQCALSDNYLRGLKAQLDLKTTPPSLIDDIVLHSVFVERADLYLRGICETCSSKQASRAQRNFMAILREMTSVVSLSMEKHYMPQRGCAVSGDAPKKVSGRLLKFKCLVVPSIEEMVTDAAVAESADRFYTDEICAQDEAYKLIRLREVIKYIDQAYQHTFTGVFLLMRFPLLISGEALRLLRAAGKLTPGADTTETLTEFLRLHPNWWADRTAAYDIGTREVLAFASADKPVPLDEFVRMRLRKMTEPQQNY